MFRRAHINAGSMKIDLLQMGEFWRQILAGGGLLLLNCWCLHNHPRE
jgi:hypothetical protein